MKKLLHAAFTVFLLLVCSSVWGATDVEFDVTSTDASAYTSYCGQTCNVTLKNKTFTAYEWDGAVFPFTASAEILDATFGEGNWDLQEFDSYDGSTIKMKAATSIVAGTPYAIRVKQTAENPTFNNVTFASSISTDFIKVTLSNDLQFWGTYFKIDWYKIVNSQGNPVTAFSFKSDGTGLGNWRPNQETFRAQDKNGDTNDGYYGTFAWFYHPTLNTTTPALSLDGISTGGGGGDDPSPTTLAGKIAARLQITDAPTIYIDLPGIGDQALGEYLYKKLGNNTTAEEAPYRPAKIQVVATSDTSSPHYLESFTEDAIDENGNTNLEIKVRGNSTALASIPTGKRPYRLKFANKKNSTDGKAHKHDLLGYGYSKRNWVLLANLNDNSLLRNALTYHIGKAVGMPFCPGYKFVDLVINNEYRGSYQISDHCEVDADRINVNEDTGWYVEFQGRNDMCDYPMCFTESGVLMNINNPEPADEDDEEQRNAVINPIKDWFLNSWGKGFGTGYTNPTTGWRAYNDEETLIKFWIATELTGDYDGLMSVKAYREADGKLCWGPLWDKDLAFGNYDSMADADGKLVANLQQASCIQPYFQKLTKDPDLMTRVKETMDNLVSGGIKATLLEKIDEMAEVVAQSAALNFERWGNPQQPGAFGCVGSLADHQAYVNQLKEWFSTRIDYVQEQFTILAEAANAVQGDMTIDAAKNQSDNGITSGLLDKYYNITLTNKTFVKDEWNAISLPFSVNEETLKSVFGDNYELKELAGIFSNGTTLYFATPADNAIIAGMPYLIKPSEDVDTSPIFNQVLLAYCSNWDNTHKPYGESVTFGDYTFSANLYLNSLNVDGTDLLIGGDASSFTFPQKVNSWETTGPVYGLNAYIRKANGAENPTISFTAEETEDLAFDVNNGTASADKVGGTYNITLENRGYLYADGWCTICLPFTITKKNFETAIGLDTKLRELAGIQGSSFNFEKVDDKTLKAGVPYLIMIDNTDTSITKDLGTVTFESTKLEASEGTSVSPKEGYAFVGILEARQLASDGTELFMGANSELYKPSSTSGKLGGGRAYFQIPGKVSASGAKISVTIDGIVTSIEEQIKNVVEPKDSRVFNLNGQKINSSNLQSLPHGIYIINGKKVMK